MIDIGYYRKIQNAHGANSLRDAQIQQIKSDLNRDFNKPLDCESVLIDGVEHDLTIIETNNLDEKKIKSRPNDSFHSGQIVYWADWYWIITKVNRRNEIVSNGKMKECTYHLYWQNESGEIIDKWAFVANASSYSNGESGNATITLSANQFLVVMPKDEDTRNLRGTRMIIDDCDDDKPTPYKLTRPDNVSVNYGNGCTYYIFTLDQRGDFDKKVTLDDGTQVWICDYITPTTPSTPDDSDEKDDKYTILCCSLKYSGNAELKVGGNYKTITGVITDENRNTTDEVGSFEVITIDELQSYITTNISDNVLKIKISDDESAIGGTVRIKFSTTDGKYSTYTDFNLISNY